MDRQTRREYFDRLCELRDAYRRRGSEDASSAITIEEMTTRANRLLEQPAAPLIAVGDGGPPAS